MTKKQWVWLLVAVAVFAAAGALSVAVNTWSARVTADAWGSAFDGFYGSEDTAAVLPSDPFLARLDIRGTILGGEGTEALLDTDFDETYILDYIDRLMESDDNVGILLYVDSGGGEMNAGDEVYLKLMDYKAATGRPIYAYFDDVACSAAYYIAMAADEIWANRNSLCVNIGVYISGYNLSGLFERYGVEEVLIKSSENKAIGSIGQPWTEEQRAIYQSMVDIWYDQFLGVVAEGRGMTKEEVRARDDGREMASIQALEAGFIDGIGRFEEYKAQVLGYFDEGTDFYEETPPEPDLFTQLLRQVSQLRGSGSARSELELLLGLMEDHGQPVVMAYAR